MKPKYLSSDHDPLLRYHRWRADLRIMGLNEVKTLLGHYIAGIGSASLPDQLTIAATETASRSNTAPVTMMGNGKSCAMTCELAGRHAITVDLGHGSCAQIAIDVWPCCIFLGKWQPAENTTTFVIQVSARRSATGHAGVWRRLRRDWGSQGATTSHHNRSGCTGERMSACGRSINRQTGSPWWKS